MREKHSGSQGRWERDPGPEAGLSLMRRWKAGEERSQTVGALRTLSDPLKSVSEGCHNEGPWTVWPKEWKLSYSSGGYVSEIKVLAGLVLFQGLSS